jgi:hypothetical protein
MTFQIYESLRNQMLLNGIIGKSGPSWQVRVIGSGVCADVKVGHQSTAMFSYSGQITDTHHFSARPLKIYMHDE